jgi:hypothetical protein
MLGLVKKDLMILKVNLGYVIFIMAFGFMAGMAPLFSVLMLLTTFNELDTWDAYCATLPNGRKCAVKEKYIITIITLAVTCLITYFLYNTIYSEYFFSGTEEMQTYSVVFKNMFLIMSIIVAVFYPLVIKFGESKGTLVFLTGIITIVLIKIVMSFGFSLVNALLGKNIFKEMLGTIINSSALSTITALIILMISYFVSKKIYANKDF